MMLLKVLERLDRRRFLPSVISLTSLGAISPHIVALGVPVDALGMDAGTPSFLGFLRLVRMLKRQRPDLVHTWMYHADLLGGVAARVAGISSIAWCIRNSNLDADKTKFSTRVVVGVCALLSRWVPSLIISCSDVARQVHVTRGYMAKKMRVVPNGFDLIRFKPDDHARNLIRFELGLDATVPLVGLVGRFDPQKNHAGFIQAAGLLNRRMPHVHFVLVGEGIDTSNQDLMNRIVQAQVRDNTHLLGLREDMPKLMAALDILASSSYGEAFPNVLGEAMACGVPCAVTDVGDSAYIVGDTGQVVAAGDMVGLADSLEMLLSLSQAERVCLGDRARGRVKEHFEIGEVVQRYEACYDELRTVAIRESKIY